MRWKYLLLPCVLALTVGAANAATFDVTGSASLPLGGTLTIAGGSVTGQDVTSTSSPISSPAFTALTSSVSSGAGTAWNITVNTPTSPSEIYYVLMVLPVSSLSSYAGGSIITAVLYDSADGFEAPIASCGEAAAAAVACGSLTAESTTPPSGTPLPAALPLFATGLGALGLLGWRRKRRVNLATAP
jgi:hypothetical protein